MHTTPMAQAPILPGLLPESFQPLIYLPDTNCHIYKKDWVDLIFRRNKRKSGINFIDENLTITSADNWTPAILLGLGDVILFLEINKRITPLKILIQHDYLSIIEELKDKTILGIETDLWIYDNKDLDTLINSGGQLIENMLNACV